MKKLTIGIIIGLMLGISTNAFATIGDSVTAVFSSFVYKVNGETKTAETPVLVYEGNSYLRTTDLANMLGFDVTYKADTRTIEFNNATSNPVIPTDPVAPIEPTEPTIDPVTGEVVPPTKTPTDGEPVVVPPTAPEAPAVVEEPAPTNAAACQGISDSWNYKIATHSAGTTGKTEYDKKVMASQRDSELANAGC